MRRQVSNSGSKYIDDRSMPVFLSWNGAKLESGQLSTAINAAWKKAGMEGHVSSTIFRKSTVTKVHGDHEEMKGDRKSTRLNSSHVALSRMPSSA